MFLTALQGGLLWAQSVADEQAIRQILVDREVAWNSRDASAWVKDFAAESRFINILGMRFPDRANNEQRHAALFATIFRNSTLTVELLELRFADPDTAIVEARLQLTGYEALPPGIGESTPRDPGDSPGRRTPTDRWSMARHLQPEYSNRSTPSRVTGAL